MYRPKIICYNLLTKRDMADFFFACHERRADMSGSLNAKEGDLYRIINIDGVQFDIHYGYYEEKDRFGKYNDSIPIYPNFSENPQYNIRGEPFVTQMQDVCEHYEAQRDGDSCHACIIIRNAKTLSAFADAKK